MKPSMPHWPAMMRRALAADYCGLSIAGFEREILAGKLPAPVRLGERELWSKVQLDQSLAVITGEAQADWRIGSPLYRDVA